MEGIIQYTNSYCATVYNKYREIIAYAFFLGSHWELKPYHSFLIHKDGILRALDNHCFCY